MRGKERFNNSSSGKKLGNLSVIKELQCPKLGKAPKSPPEGSSEGGRIRSERSA